MTDNSASQKPLLVSIVTVTFNAEAFLEKTLTSVKQQTYPNIEYLIIDGNSTDNTKAIDDSYRDIVTTLISEPDQDIYDAMNKGLQLCSDQWVLFLNAGDFFNNEQSIKNAVTEIAGDTDIIYSDVILSFDCLTKAYFLWKSDLKKSKPKVLLLLCLCSLLGKDKFFYLKYEIKYSRV